MAAKEGAAAAPTPTFTPEVRPKRSDGVEVRRNYRKARREQSIELTAWWLDRMVRVEQPASEKLTLLWHNHWATSVQKAGRASFIRGQLGTLRTRGTGDFRELVRAMVRDPALLIWLDGPQNAKGKPNENLGRELMELFTLGVGNYPESGVWEAALALTGASPRLTRAT